MRQKVKLFNCLKLLNSDGLRYDDIMNAFSGYSINELEQLALELYHPWVSDTVPIELRSEIMHNILCVRADKLNDNHVWTNENVNELVRVSDLFVAAAEKACDYEEALYKELKAKKNKDEFLMDYDIEIEFTPYLKGYEKFENDENSSSCFMYVLCEPLGNQYNYILSGYIGKFCNKEVNWNTEYFEDALDCFKDKYISYAVHELLDTSIWSFHDIMSINRISIDVNVIHQSFIGDYPENDP